MNFRLILKRVFRDAGLLRWAFVLILGGMGMLPAQTRPIPEILSGLFEKAVREQGFEGQVLVADSGRVLFRGTKGFADCDRTAFLNSRDRFPIASITKLFTALVILQLEEEGRLSTTSEIGALLPGYPIDPTLTIHELLLHISGLPEEPVAIFEKPTDPDTFVKTALASGAGAVPRGEFHYNNLDYVLLGQIIARTENRSWEESVRERILKPCGMTDTGFLSEAPHPEGLVCTFHPDETGGAAKDPPRAWGNYSAAGNMFSTADDLLALDRALYGELLVSEASKAKLYTSYPEYNYSGYSVWTYPYPFLENQPRVMERRGGILGFSGVLVRLLDQHRTIIILSNNGRFNPDSFGDEENLKESLLRAMGALP